MLLAVALGAVVGAQDFVRVDVPLPDRGRRVEARQGVWFALESGAITCEWEGRTAELGATTDPGPWHELTALPWGTVVAAGGRGLFVADPEHLVLDPADLRDGGPPAGVRSVAADQRGRLWWCSEQDFGVIEPRLRFGRRFGPDDGLPPPPYERLALADDGRVLLAAAAGTFAYRPDAGAPPAASNAWPVDRVLRATADGSVALAFEAAARGGAQLRVRRRHHHLLQPLDGGVVRGLRPGRHVLELHAFDRDLRGVRLGEVAVDVPLPAGVDLRMVAAAGLAAALLAFAWAWRRAGERPFARRLGRAALRAAVLLAVALQLVAACLGYGRSWPFVGFSMYTETWRAWDVVFRPRIVAVRANGERLPLHEHDAGVHQDGYWQMLAEAAFGGDAAAAAFFDRLVRAVPAHPSPLVGFTLGDGRIRLTPDGPVDVAPTVLVAWRRP